MRWLFALSSLFWLTSCRNESPYYSHNFFDQFPLPYAYAFLPAYVTPDGMRVDTSGLPVDLTKIDQKVREAEACLLVNFGMPPVIPPETRAIADCDSDTFPLPLLRHDIHIKVASDWIPSCDGTQELLPAPSPVAGCLDKGLTPTEACPCHWRAGIQSNDLIVVTPDLYMLKDPIVRMVTGCNNVWTPPLAACVAP